MTAKLGRVTLVLAAAVALTSCQDDITIEKAQWETLTKEMIGKVTGMKKGHAEMLASLAGLQLPTGNDALTLAKTAFEAKLGAQGAAIEGLDKGLSAAKAAIEPLMMAGKKEPLMAAISAQKSTLGGLMTKVTDMMTSNTAEMGNMQKMIADAAAAPAGGGMVPSVDDMAKKLAEAFKMKGAKLDFSDIDFKAGTATIDAAKPTSKATLEKLVTFMKSCKELSVDVVGHTSKEGKPAANEKLSLDRANSIKAYLVKAGIGAKQIAKTAGNGSKTSLVAEPEADSAEAKAMKPEELEALRNKNRRIEVDVVTPCP